MIDIVLVLEHISQIPQWVLKQLFVTPTDIVDFFCDKVYSSQKFLTCPESKPFLFLHIVLGFIFRLASFISKKIKAIIIWHTGNSIISGNL